MPSFLRLPRRSEKPRFVGLTHVIDKGLPLPDLHSQLAATSEYVDVWKLGFGTAYLDPTVEEKVAALSAAGVRACLGGTLLEVALAEGRESGTVGLYHSDGRVREDLADTLASVVGLRWVAFEAPRAAQQAWFVRRYGSAVNLGNIAPGELLAVESLRLGLRADTFGLGQPVLETADDDQPAVVGETA